MRILKNGAMSLNRKDKLRLIKHVSFKVHSGHLPIQILLDVMKFLGEGNYILKQYDNYETVLRVWNELGD